MRMDEMILVSVNDHVCEPPGMLAGRLAASWQDRAPRVVSQSKPIVDKIQECLNYQTALLRSTLGAAIGYANELRLELKKFLDDTRILSDSS